MWQIGETIASRYSTKTGDFFAKSSSTFRFHRMRCQRSATRQTIDQVRGRQVLPGQFALRRRHIRCYSALTRFLGESTNSAWMEEFLACSASQENNRANSAGFTSLLVRPKTNYTLLNS